MDEAQNCAVIENGIVTNIVWIIPGPEFENTVPYGDICVQIGDSYVNGEFYRNGILVKSINDTDE